MLSRYFTKPVEVHRAPLVKDTYAKKRDWDNSEVIWTGLGCEQPDNSWESRSPERDTVQERLALWLPPSATGIDPADRLVVRGSWWEIDGEPRQWLHGSLKHIKLILWRVRH